MLTSRNLLKLEDQDTKVSLKKKLQQHIFLIFDILGGKLWETDHQDSYIFSDKTERPRQWPTEFTVPGKSLL